jgi:hypothetical protein
MGRRDRKAFHGSFRSELLLLPIIVFSAFLGLSSSIADTDLYRSKFSVASSKSSAIEYGEVIYQCNEENPNQLFIIGMSHRDSLTRLNGSNTSRVQAEVYKIGEWLIHQRGVELLLPEGFFLKKPTKIEKIQSEVEKKSVCPKLDIKALEGMLSKNDTFVNAELLLKTYHSLRLKQVEDESLYGDVYREIQKLVNSGSNACDSLAIKAELDYLQERRTAAMLQKIPGLVGDEFQQGHIRSRKAIFTVGMSHLYKILEYLNEKRIRISSPLAGNPKDQDYIAELSLQREKFGIFVILPRTLADDSQVLKMNRLDKVPFLNKKSPPL